MYVRAGILMVVNNKKNAGPSREQSHPREPMQLQASMRALSTTYDEDRMPTSPEVLSYPKQRNVEHLVCSFLDTDACVQSSNIAHSADDP